MMVSKAFVDQSLVDNCIAVRLIVDAIIRNGLGSYTMESSLASLFLKSHLLYRLVVVSPARFSSIQSVQ
jgi:hypothetical protein